jgi:hypothetical protein
MIHSSPEKIMSIPILVENEEVFAKLNYLRDFVVLDGDVSSWDAECSLYVEEASNKQVQDGYVLTLEEINSILALIV